jgi:hypothetical protein
MAQTNAAQQAVRQRVSGLGQGEQPETLPEDAPPAAVPQRARTTPAAGSAAGAIDTTYIAPGAAAVVVIRPAQIMTSPITEMLPTEVATAAGLKYLGFDPAEVEEVIAFGDLSNPGMPGYGLTIKFNKPFKASSIPAERRAHAQLVENGLGGKHYLQSQIPMMPSFYGPNNKTLVVASEETLRQMVEAQGQSTSGPILDRVRQARRGADLYVAVDIASLRQMAGGFVDMAAAQAPPDLQPMFGIANLISAAELTVNLTGPGPISLVAHANDEAAAEQILSLLNDVNQKSREKLKSQLGEQAASEDPLERAFAQYAERVSDKGMSQFMPKREGASLTLFHTDGLDESQKKMVIAGLGMAAAAALPAITAAREGARRDVSMNSQKQIMLALLNHESAKRALPAHAIYSEDGQPLLSWRVQILPYLEQQALYDQFHLDEPWDSEHNKSLIAQMPAVYASPNLKLEPGKTNYLALVGNECAFNGTKEGVRLRDITDGTSNTISVVEADPAQAVEWTKPDDLEFNPDDPKAGLGNVRPGGWNAAYCDGSVQFIAEGVDAQQLRALITRAGGEPVQRPLPGAAPVPAGFAPVQEVPVGKRFGNP